MHGVITGLVPVIQSKRNEHLLFVALDCRNKSGNDSFPLNPTPCRAKQPSMPRPSAATPDAVPGNWVMRAPKPAQPYLRLMRADRPIGTWLLLLPCWQGLALAAALEGDRLIYIYYAALFALGAVVMRGAGCAYNDIVDRDIDARVARTAARPIPAGRISLARAWMFLAALFLIGLAVLLQFNSFAILTGLASLALVAAYPFMKRITYWPQLWLGLTFNWGALVGYAAAAHGLSPAAFALYGAGIFWTMGYDTIYAYQDREDDALIGVKSTALRFGDRPKGWLAGFYAACLALLALAGLLGGLSAVYFIALSPAAAHFFRQLRRLDIGDTDNCLTLFRSNRNAGLLMLAAPLCEAAKRLL
jgi:4-hydroxybenzoate polyprenyltransferase